jgi:hypothetical protein
MKRSVMPANLPSEDLRMLVAVVEAGQLDADDPAILAYVLSRVRGRVWRDSVELHNICFNALMALRRALSDAIPMDRRSVREAAQLRSLTGERMVATVRRSVRQALEEEQRCAAAL